MHSHRPPGRDASLTLDALWVAACPAEADRFFDFLGATALIQVREDGELQSVFGIEGEHELTKRDLHWLTGWRNARTAVRQAILNRGWSVHAGAFTQSFRKAEMDAAALLLPQVGFLPADDRRVLGTMDAIEARLTDPNGFVYRCRMHDGLPGDEGPFLICTFWLAQVRAMAGQIEQAVRIFERAAACANDIGLLAEQVHPTSGEPLGNFPRAFSHIVLVNAAQAIGEARKRAEAGTAGAASAADR